MDQQRFQCTRCRYSTREYNRLLRHYEFVHSHEDYFQVTCGVDNCVRVYKSVICLKRHINRFHRHFGRVQLNDNVPVDVNLDYLVMGGEIDGDDNNDGNHNHGDYDYNKRMATFMLTLREEYKTSEAGCEYAINEMSNLLQLNNEQFASKINEQMQQNGAVNINVADVMHGQNTQAIGGCESVSTMNKLHKYVKNHMNYISPEEHILGYNDAGTRETMQYIPLLENLKSLLCHEDILTQILTNRQSQDAKRRDYCDGRIYKSCALFRDNPTALQIIYYIDDFTLTNPYRDRSKKYKISGQYYTLGNLEPKYRAKLDTMQLSILCRTSYIKKYGLNAVLQPLLRDVAVLETEGISFEYEGREFNFFGTITFISADNLGAHNIARMPENFSTSLRQCRFCNVTKHNMFQQYDETYFQRRTIRTWNQHATIGEQNQAFAKLYGIKDHSPFNELQHYHVATGLPSDLAHDLFEGIVPEICETMLRQFVADGHFTFGRLSDIIRQFVYSEVDRDNVVPVLGLTEATFRIKFTQAQTFCFAKLLPIMIGTHVPHDSRHWDLFLELIEIIEHLFSPSFTQEDIMFIRGLIQGFNDMFDDVMQAERTKPKRHYMIHYPSQMMDFGPLSYCTTMRFEAKHEQFKDFFRKNKNRKNPCKSLAERHQSRQALLQSKSNILDANTLPKIFGNKEFFTVFLPADISQLIVNVAGDVPSITSARKVTMSGTSYIEGSAVAICVNDDDNLQYVFGEIQHIFMVNNIPYLCCHILNTDQYSRHHHAYILSDTNTYELKVIGELLDHNPMGIYTVNNSKAVIPKYHIPI